MRHRKSGKTPRRPRGKTSPADKGIRTAEHDQPSPRAGRGQRRGTPARGAPSPSGAFWIYGRHPVMAALANPRRRCLRLSGTREALDTLGALDLPSSLPREIRTRQEMDALTGGDSPHQGLALEVLPLEEYSLEDTASPQEHDLLVVLDRITDPHNAGAILRSAAAFGARAVIMTSRHSPPESGVLAKSASGALETVPIVRVTNLARALEKLADMGYWRIGLEGSASTTIARAAGRQANALVMGAEGSGLRRLTREHCDVLATIPISAAMESLNVSNAAAIALYALRQHSPLP